MMRLALILVEEVVLYGSQQHIIVMRLEQVVLSMVFKLTVSSGYFGLSPQLGLEPALYT
jgi:hypothetical protein